MILFDEFEASGGSGGVVAPPPSSPVAEPGIAPEVEPIHPEKMGELLDRPDFQEMPYDKRIEWVNNVGNGIYSWLQKRPDVSPETSSKFADFMSATYEKVKPPQAQGVIGSFVSPITEDIVPNTIGTAAGIGAGIATVAGGVTAPAAPIADIAAATAATYGAKKAQNAIRGPAETQRAQELLAANQAAHPWASGAGSLVASIPTMLNPTSWFKAGTKATVAKKLANTAAGGARMGGITGGKSAAEGKTGVGGVLTSIVHDGLVTAPLGFFGPAKNILTAIGIKAPKEALTMAFANELWDAAREMRAPDFSKLIGEAGKNIPAFLIFNAVGHGMAARGKSHETTPEEPPSVSTQPPIANRAVAQDQISVFHVGQANPKFEEGRTAWFTDSKDTAGVYQDPNHELHFGRRSDRGEQTVTPVKISGKFLDTSDPAWIEKLTTEAEKSITNLEPDKRGGFWFTGTSGNRRYANGTETEARSKIANQIAKEAIDFTELGEAINVNDWPLIEKAGFTGIKTPAETGGNNYATRKPETITSRPINPAALHAEFDQIMSGGDTGSDPWRAGAEWESRNPKSAERINEIHAQIKGQEPPTTQTNATQQEQIQGGVQGQYQGGSQGGQASQAGGGDSLRGETPSQVGLPSESGTSIRHADIEQQLSETGVGASPRGGGWTDADARVEANKRAADPEYAAKRLKFYEENPNERSDKPDNLVIADYIKTIKTDFLAKRDTLRALGENDPARDKAAAEFAEAETNLRRARDVADLQGSRAGAELQARKTEANDVLENRESFILSLEALKGRELDAKERAKVDESFKREEATDKQIAAKTKELEKVRTRRKIQRVIDEVAKEKKAGGAKRFNDFVDEKIAAAKARLRGQGGVVSVKFDPFGLVDHAIIGAGYIAKGVVKLSEWAKQMLEDFGEAIRPHLNELYAMSKAQAAAWRKEFAEAPKTPAEVVASHPTDTPIIPDALVLKLVRAHVEAGETNPEGLLSKVHADLQSIRPEQTEPETATAISGIGKIKLPDPAPLRQMERELKKLIGLQEKLRIAKEENKQPPKHGLQFDKPTERVKSAQKELDDYLAANPHLQPKDPATQLASARTALVNRLNGQIEELNSIIEGRYKKRPQRPGVPDDPEILGLKKEVGELRAYVNDLSGTPDLTLEEWNSRLEKAANRTEQYYRDRIAKQQFVDEPKTSREKFQATKDAQAKVKQAREDFESERLRVRPDIPADKAVAQMQDRLMNRLAEIKSEIDQRRAGTFTPSAGRTSTPYSPEISALQAEFSAHKAILEGLKPPRSNSRMTPEQRIAAALKVAEKTQKRLQDRIANGEFGKSTPDVGATSPYSPSIGIIKTANEALKKQIRDTRDWLNPKDADAAYAESLLKRTQKSLADIQSRNAKAQAGDPKAYERDKRERKVSEDIQRQLDSLRAQKVAANEVKKDIQYKAQLAAEPGWRKLSRSAVRIRRPFILLTTPIYLKLAAAGNVIRPLMTLAEETMGRAWAKLIMPDVMKNAESQGGASGMNALADYLSGMKTGFGQVGQVLKTGKTTNQAVYGQKKSSPTQLEDYFVGHTHMAMKAPAWEAAFKVSEGNQLAHAGITDPTVAPPEVIEGIRRKAAVEADHAIYTNENRAVRGYQRVVGAIESVGGAGALVADVMRVENTIVKIPTNLIAEASKYLFGSLYAPIKNAVLRARQDGKLTQQQYEDIARTFKKGSAFATLVAIAAYAPLGIRVGGLYAPGERRKKDDLDADDVEVMGVKMPHILTHAGFFTAIQALGTGIREFQQSQEKDHGMPYASMSGLMMGSFGLASGVPFARGTADLIGALNPSREGDYPRQKFAKGFVPAPLRTWAEAQDYTGSDPVLKRLLMGNDRHDVIQRKTRDPIEAVQSAIPYWRQYLDEKSSR